MNKKVFEEQRMAIHEVAAQVEGVDQIPSRRAVDIMYRGQNIAQVPCTCLLNECETRLMAEIKAVAVNSALLNELNVETLLGCVPVAADKALKIEPDFLTKVVFDNCSSYFQIYLLKIKF